MPFEKGNKASNGRPKGAKSKKTLILEGFIHSILEGGAEKFHDEVMKLKGKDFINVYKDLIEYGLPKLARKELVEERPVQKLKVEIVDYADSTD